MALQIRRGTAAAITTANPTLAAGEPVWESDTGRLKIGDGTTAWTSLPYAVPKRPAFAIWAEENGALAANAYEWAFGNGANTPNGMGVVLPFACELFAVGLSLLQGSASVRVQHDGTTVATIDSRADGNLLTLGTPVAAVAGDVVGFQTATATGTGTPNIVTAWYRET